MQVSYIFRKIRSSKERILKWNRQKKISLKVRQMSFVMRTSKPSVGDKYDICKANGGYSNAILEYPKDSECDVLSNCVEYA